MSLGSRPAWGRLICRAELRASSEGRGPSISIGCLARPDRGPVAVGPRAVSLGERETLRACAGIESELTGDGRSCSKQGIAAGRSVPQTDVERDTRRPATGSGAHYCNRGRALLRPAADAVPRVAGRAPSRYARPRGRPRESDPACGMTNPVIKSERRTELRR